MRPLHQIIISSFSVLNTTEFHHKIDLFWSLESFSQEFLSLFHNNGLDLILENDSLFSASSPAIIDVFCYLIQLLYSTDDF